MMGSRGFLFDAAAQTLYRLNRTGAFVWCLLAEGMAAADIVGALAAAPDSDRRAAEACVHAAIDHWHALGLVTADNAPSYRILGRDFAVRFSDSRLEQLGSALLGAHRARFAAEITATLVVERRDDGAIAIGSERETMQVLPDAHTLAPAVFASLMKLALVHSPSHPALHAGCVRRSGGVVLFPAASGSGKSTLMAGLLAAGYDVRGDDTVVFEHDTLRVRPLTPYVCVKSGAWTVVSERLPEFAALPSFVRADGAQVRYLLARGKHGDGDRSDEAGVPVRAIVFPRYRAGKAVRCARIGDAHAFRKLLADLDPIGRPLTADLVNRLIRWVGSVECYSLSYGSLDDAISTLRKVLA